MIVADFICNKERICRLLVPVVPDKGEVIRLDDEPYLVKERNWSFGTDKTDLFYCYLKVKPI